MTINTIQILRDRLDLIEDDASLLTDLIGTGIFEELAQDLEEKHQSREKRRAKTPRRSPLLALFGDNDVAGQKLAQYLHDKYQVSDRARLEPYTHPHGNLDLMAIKRHFDNFVLMRGSLGWCAFKPKDSPTYVYGVERGVDYSKDRGIVYIGIFSLFDGSDIMVKEITSTRGGRYDRPEKKGVTTRPVADQMAEFIGGLNKNVKVYKLVDRDEPGLKDLPPERFSGQRSRNIGAAGASVQRAKARARDVKNLEPDALKLTQQLAKRLWRTAPNIVRAVIVRRTRKGLVPVNPLKKTRDKFDPVAQRMAPKPILDSGRWVNLVMDATNNARINDIEVKAAISQYKQDNPTDRSSDDLILLKLANRGNVEVLQSLFKEIRSSMEQAQDLWI